MKISDAIKSLQSAKKKYGDIECQMVFSIKTDKETMIAHGGGGYGGGGGSAYKAAPPVGAGGNGGVYGTLIITKWEESA